MSVNFDIKNLENPDGLDKFDAYMSKNNYMSGYRPSQLDVQAYTILAHKPLDSYIHAQRWFNHINSFTTQERNAFPGKKMESTAVRNVEIKMDNEKKSQETKPADDFDPFASDDEDNKVEEKKPVAAISKKKKEVINKSQLVIDVKPASLKVNLDELEKLVKQIKIEGLTWSITCKKIPIAYGIVKMQIGCNIIDELVNVEDIVSAIECLGLSEEKKAEYLKRKEMGDDSDDEDYDEDYDEDQEPEGLVQSAEIVSFNKL